MDVFKLQKMNNLASELRKHNLAESSDVAFKQAEEVFDESKVASVCSGECSCKSVKSDALSERRFEMLLEQQRLKYEQELNLLRSALGIVSKEIESLKSDIKGLSVSNVPKPKEHQEPLVKVESKEVHPRQGNYKPGDIDIQKMFYCGK